MAHTGKLTLTLWADSPPDVQCNDGPAFCGIRVHATEDRNYPKPRWRVIIETESELVANMMMATLGACPLAEPPPAHRELAHAARMLAEAAQAMNSKLRKD